MSMSSARVALLASFLTFSSLASAQSLQVELRSKCPVTAPAGAGGGQKMAVLAGLLIQQVISKGVDIAGSALAAAAKDKVTTLSGESASATYYTVDEKANLVTDTSVGCVVLFTAGSGGASNPEWMSKVTADMTQLKSVPDFYMEIELEHIAANDGIKATPQMLYVGKSLAPGNGWFRKQGKDYVVAVSLSSEETGASFGAMSFSFKNIDTGKAYVRVQPNGLTNQLERIADWPISARLPKLPESDATKEAASDRKTAIANYVEANGILKRAALTPLVKTPIESNTAYHDMVRKLCDQIVEANKAIPAGRSEKVEGTQQRFSDPRCPLALWDAKLAADKASTEAQVSDVNNEVTMGLQDLDEPRYPIDGDKFKSIVIHEFGHALGLAHEHQHPVADCFPQFNLIAIKQAYEWSDKDVDENLKTLQLSSVAAEDKFYKTGLGPDGDVYVFSNMPDRLSVMRYDLRSEDFKQPPGSCFDPTANSEPSSGDQAAIARAYPKSNPTKGILANNTLIENVLKTNPNITSVERAALKAFKL